MTCLRLRDELAELEELWAGCDPPDRPEFDGDEVKGLVFLVLLTIVLVWVGSDWAWTCGGIALLAGGLPWVVYYFRPSF